MAISKNRRLLTSYFSVVLSISIVLFMMGAFFLIAFNANKISDDFKEKIPITIYLKNNAKKIVTIVNRTAIVKGDGRYLLKTASTAFEMFIYFYLVAKI